MQPFRPLSTSEQLAEHLRREIVGGTLNGTMPGINQLVRSLGVNSMAASKAVKQLEREGLVISQGARRPRVINNEEHSEPSPLKVGILYYDAMNSRQYDAIVFQQALTIAGHKVIIAPKSMQEMGMDVKRTARQAQSINVDAWVIYAGQLKILEWFNQQDKPAFALYGRHNTMDMAGMKILKTPVLSTLVKTLVSFGHNRIVMLAREERRHPQLGNFEQFFIDELKSHEIQTGAYNIPDWKDTPGGLEEIIHSLFAHTPPTALIVQDSQLFHATQLHLAKLGLFAPQHISLFCTDSERNFKWVRPEISHIEWDHRPSTRRVIQWAKNISKGVDDSRKSETRAAFYEGGTIGPVPKTRG